MAAPVPRLVGRLHARDIGLVINVRDPYSEAVGAYYIDKRALAPHQVLRVDLPVRATLTPDEFAQLKSAIDKAFGPEIQALALAWVGPFAVNCNSLTGALALGYDDQLCRQTCSASRRSPYANARTARPFTDLKLRPSMLLAARSVDEAKALIDRGVKSDRSLGLRGSLPVQAAYVSSRDAARNVREPLYPREMSLVPAGLEIVRAQDISRVDAQRLVLMQVGLHRLPPLPDERWVPGALADHLTSVGGVILGPNDQSTVLDWIASGATASHGAVSEPCNHLQKFPNPQWLLLHYLQGATAIEAYWKSVLWPQQSLFVGEPLAAPFARR